MNLLLVEDDEFKKNAIMNVIAELNLSINVSVEKSVQAAIENITNNVYDLILLDMALPSHNIVQGKGASASMPSGGMEVVMELSYYERSDNVIILTQYSEIELDNILFSLDDAHKKVRKDYNVSLISVIRFKRERNEWRQALAEGVRVVKDAYSGS